jgi:hypothetical protein
MSTLQILSQMIGRAMNLPPVFFAPIPFSSILDSSLRIPTPLSSTRGRRSRRFRFAKSHKRPSSSKAPARHHHFTLEGLVTVGGATKFAVNNEDFVVTATTWIIGELKTGALARVKGALGPDGSREAASVVVLGAT